MIKRRHHIFYCSLAICILIINLTGCAGTETSNEITIGVAWPFASDQSLFEEGIDLAVQDINEEGGIGGKKLTLLKVDDASEVTSGMAAARRLTENDSVRAVIGHKSSYISIPASAIYEEAGLVMLSPASTSPELTGNDSKSIFRMIPNDEVIAEKVAEYLMNQGLEKIVLFYTKDSYGKGLADAFEDQSIKYGITVVDRFHDYSGTEELKRLEGKWRAFGYDGFFVAASIAEGSKFIYDAGQAGVEGIFTGGNALDYSGLMEAAGVSKESIVIGSVFDLEGSKRAESYKESFTDTYGQAPDIYAALGYDSVRILAEALNNSISFDRSELAEELMALGKWVGVCGDHEFSESGDDIGDLVILKELREGIFSNIER